jgi:PEGA domain-containing protein
MGEIMKTGVVLRRILCSSLLVFQTAAFSVAEGQQPVASESRAFVLEDGTPIKLRLSQTVSSADAHVNDLVEFEVLEDVMVGDVVVIPKGAAALGTVTEAVPKRRMARGGKLEIVMDSVRLVDGQKAPLRAVKEAKGGGHTGGMTVGIVATAIVFWPAAPLFLLMHGKDITFPKGTDVPTFVNGDMKLDPAQFQAQGGSTQSGAISAASSLAISSTPVGADIYVDQNFVGNTPSTVSVASGKHSISVRKAGFQDWVRDMNLSGGAITLNAELVSGSTVPAPVAAASQAQQAQVVDATQTDVSVAEAARQNKAAKAKPTPPPQQ